MHARFALFPPGRDAGLNEVLRVLHPGGAFRTALSGWEHTA